MKVFLILMTILALTPAAVADPEPSDVVQDALYRIVCVSVDPPRVELGKDCGPVAFLEDAPLP